MNANGRQKWVRIVLFLGALYFVIGFAFARFAGWAASEQMRVTWNRAAFVISAIAFAVHVGYEHFRRRSRPRSTAWHTSLAVALGAFGLALAANIHDLWSISGYRPRMLVALVAWPLLTGVPAFIVALVAAAVLCLVRRSNR
jgi:hypothetical protein